MFCSIQYIRRCSLVARRDHEMDRKNFCVDNAKNYLKIQQNANCSLLLLSLECVYFWNRNLSRPLGRLGFGKNDIKKQKDKQIMFLDGDLSQEGIHFQIRTKGNNFVKGSSRFDFFLYPIFDCRYFFGGQMHFNNRFYCRLYKHFMYYKL